jgi:hypothetical protein
VAFDSVIASPFRRVGSDVFTKRGNDRINRIGFCHRAGSALEAVANAWRQRGLEPGEGVAILVRNHRGFIDALFTAAKCGARSMPRNPTGKVLKRELPVS